MTAVEGVAECPRVRLFFGTFNGVKYVSLTRMCSDAGAVTGNVMRPKAVSAFINELRDQLGVEPVYRESSAPNSCIWVVPELVTFLAMRISVKFGVQVTLWLEQWKAKEPANAAAWHGALEALEATAPNDLAEQRVVAQLCTRLRAEGQCPLTEVAVHAGTDGMVDVLTDSDMFEVKRWTNWRHALGQVLTYSVGVEPRRRLSIVLFDDEEQPLPEDARAEIAAIAPRYGVNTLVMHDNGPELPVAKHVVCCV